MSFSKALLCLAVFLSSSPSIANDATTDADINWSGRINFGGSVTDGNTKEKNISLDGELSARTDQNRYIIDGDYNYEESAGNTTEDEYSLEGEYDHFIDKQLFAGAHVKFEQDEIAKLDSRITAGPFAGYQFYEQDDLNLSSRLGVDYMTEEFENGNENEDVALAWNMKYDQKILQDSMNLQLFHKHDLTTPIGDSESFLFESETGVRFPIAKILTGTAQIDFDWDNNPEPAVRENDTKYSLKLGYEF